MKKILVPTDFSIPADSAIRYALKMAELFDASLILYHCFIPFESGFYPRTMSTKDNLENMEIIVTRLTKIKNTILKKNPNFSISVHVDQGPEEIRLIAFCKKNKIDLIIMGTAGASGLKEKFIGSFTAEIITKSPCPVIAIPENYKFKLPSKITYASNYFTRDKKVLQSLLELNQLFNAKINILHIDWGITLFTADVDFEKYKKTIENHFKNFEFTYNHLAGKDVAETILQETILDKTDMIVINPLKRKGIWNRIFHTSVTKKTAYHLHVPLLVIPSK